MSDKTRPRSKYVLLILLAACLLVTAGFLTLREVLRDRVNLTGPDLTSISAHYKSVTAENMLISFIVYDSAQAALDAAPMVVLGEIVEVIQPFDRQVDMVIGSPEQEIANKLNSTQESVVRITGYHIRIIESFKGNFSTSDIVVSYNFDLFDQQLTLDVGDRMVWTLADSPQPVGHEFSTESVYTFITPGLSAFYLTPDQHLVPLCREANGNLLENLSLHELRTWSAGG
jgi:hypothetical protein